MNVLYSVLDDRRQAHKVNEVLQAEPNITQKELYSRCITNWYRLKYLEQQGYIKLNRRKHEQRTETSHTQI